MKKLLLSVCALLLVSPLAAQSVESIIKHAEQAVESGNVDINRDIKPLIDALKASGSEEDQEDLVEAIEELGAGDGSSPVAVKRYLLEEAVPLFLQIGRSANDVFLRGGVFLALRDLGASREVLEEAATIAEADSHDYVKSRGEILRGFLSSMPAAQLAPEVAAIRSVDPEEEREALAFLKSRRLGASMDQLRSSAQSGKADEVQALINAGVQVNPYEGRPPLTAAVFSGCGASGGGSPGLVETIKVLLAAGAQVNRPDDNNNIALILAGQMCGPEIIGVLLDGGSEVNWKNFSGISALGMALIMQKLDSAKVLVERGARLDTAELQMVSGTATSDEAKEILRKATGN